MREAARAKSENKIDEIVRSRDVDSSYFFFVFPSVA